MPAAFVDLLKSKTLQASWAKCRDASAFFFSKSNARWSSTGSPLLGPWARQPYSMWPARMYAQPSAPQSSNVAEVSRNKKAPSPRPYCSTTSARNATQKKKNSE
eukprot:scaffold655_cov225-Pinguiococcus_pyrenoidosus.AAC.4